MPDRLLIRTSLLSTVDVPRGAIDSAVRVSEMPLSTREDPVLRATLGAPPVLLLTLSRRVVARGPLGLRRSGRRIALYVDDPARLTSWIEEPCVDKTTVP